MLCVYSIGAPIGAGLISREKHYHPLTHVEQHISVSQTEAECGYLHLQWDTECTCRLHTFYSYPALDVRELQVQYPPFLSGSLLHVVL